jgi:hypothetical protein
MLEWMVKQFIRSYYEGVKSIDFYMLGERRVVQINFYSLDDMKKGYVDSGPARQMWNINEEYFTLTTDRDAFESVLATSILKDGLDAQVKKIVEEMDKLECEEDEEGNE